ncbi:hypothetical protein G6F68_016073 [Rhizopus microsporus]|nr:hypothetical protein G6F68_016073 [Rhizopus microsporus]
MILFGARGLPPEIAMLCGVAMAAAIGYAIGWLAIRRTGIYFAMITLALSQLSGLTGVGLRNNPDLVPGAGLLLAAGGGEALAAHLARPHPAGGGRLPAVVDLRFSQSGHRCRGRGAGRPAGAQPARAAGRPAS